MTLIGNLGRDPEIRRLDSGVAVAQFSVATTESYKDNNGQWQDNTEWHDVVLWRHHAERAERQLRKGMLVYVEGKLTHQSWQDKEGVTRRKTEVVGNYVRILDRRENSYDGPRVTEGDTSTPPQKGSETDTQTDKPETKTQDPEEVLPF